MNDSDSKGGGCPVSRIGRFFFCLFGGKCQHGKPRHGEKWKVPGLGLEMVWIKPGTFTMGSPMFELGREADETQHEVVLTEGFWLGRHEVTQAQWKALMGGNPSRFMHLGGHHPVEKISWDQAVEFCAKLTEVERAAGRLPANFEYALPTEAQWEYACRAGTTSALNSGKELTAAEGTCPNLDEVAWYEGNSGGKTHPLGRKRANAWGLCDMHGNLWEWCADWLGDYGDEGLTDPAGPPRGEKRVLRGGGWRHQAWTCRSSKRYGCEPDQRLGSFGFRVALRFVPAPAKAPEAPTAPKAPEAQAGK